jgi:gluconate 2-dehydrogenase gamma chain
MSKDQNSKNNGSHQEAEKDSGISRRSFLKLAGMSVAGLAGASIVGCEPAQDVQTVSEQTSILPQPIQYPAVPPAPSEPLDSGALRFFNPHDALTVEAFTARLLPGSPDDPGAREAGVVYYLDHLLSYEGGFAEPTYRQEPFAESYKGDRPPGQEDPRAAFGVIWVSEEDIERYGYQSELTPREVMRIGLSAVDRYANERFGSAFIELSEEQQDTLIQEMVDGNATGFEPLTGTRFFHVMRRYTAEGMFSDPVYGGNRGFAGWRLVGFPGAQRAYLPGMIQREGSGLEVEIWGLQHLPHFNPGQNVGQGEINPVTGSQDHPPTHSP